MGIFILKGSRERRAIHWEDIKSRVITHEGELLSGKKGEDYQKKYSKKYLGRDLGQTKKISALDVEKFEKTGK